MESQDGDEIDSRCNILRVHVEVKGLLMTALLPDVSLSEESRLIYSLTVAGGMNNAIRRGKKVWKKIFFIAQTK